MRASGAERGLLPHTNLGVLSRADLARLREVTASQGLMLESVNPDLVAHQGSPTKHPAERLATIAAAQELRIPFTSGILVGIGESERTEAALEALAGFDHLQEVILQNFVPHRRYYGEEPAEIATVTAEGFWRTGLHDGPVHDAPGWASPVGIEDMKRLIAETRRLMPGIGIQVPPNLDWWSGRRGRHRPRRPVRQRRPHLPEHLFPSPHQVRRRLAEDGVALAERLCVPALHRPRVDRPARARRDPRPISPFIPRRGESGTSPATIERARAGRPLAPMSWRRCSPRAGPR